MTNKYDNYSDDQLIGQILGFESAKKEADSNIKVIKDVLLQRKDTEIKTMLAKKPEPFGTASINIGSQKVTFDTPKKVEWDQAGLKKLYMQIAADPDENPDEYIKTKFEVSETAYKAWPSHLKAEFTKYRTVTPGNVSVKIEDAKGK